MLPVFFDRVVMLFEQRRRAAAANRHSRVALSSMDARTLRDIGITRHGLSEAALDAVNDNPAALARSA